MDPLLPAGPIEQLAGRGRLAAALFLAMLLFAMMMVAATGRDRPSAPHPRGAPVATGTEPTAG